MIEKTSQIIRELANPTEAILNLIYPIKEDPSTPKQIYYYATIAESQARCLVEIIQRNAVP